MRSEATGEDHPLSCDILIRNGYIVTVDARRRVLPRGAIAIDGRTIVAVGEDGEVGRRYRARASFDAKGATVHPGFIDPHNHIVHGTCRGLYGPAAGPAPRIPFADWKADVTPEDEHVGTQLACLELLRNGFTGFVEPGSVFEPDAVAEAVRSVGVRALLAGCYLWDQVEIMRHLGGLESRALYGRSPPNLERCLDQLGSQLHRNSDPDALVRGYVALYGMGTASDELLRAAKSAADAAGVMLHQHEGYTPAASRADRERLGRSRVLHLAELGILGHNSVLIHMNVWDEPDLPLIVESGVGVVWCPLGYLHLGISNEIPCRMPILIEKGIPVSLGTDGALDCTIGDAALGAFFLAIGVGRPVTPGQLIEMQTIAAARAAGLSDRLGSIEVGKRADIVVRSTHAAESYPAVNPVHQLALTSRAGTVDRVFVDGRLIVSHGRSTMLDEDDILARAQESVKRRMKRLDLAPLEYWPARG
jgi:5-methylthioadenosine/S-adenosylhomocysteine deaminase